MNVSLSCWCGKLLKMTQSKRILLTKAMLEDIGYKDMKCLDLLEHDRGDIFKAQYKPVAMTLEQLQRDPQRCNERILMLTVSAGSGDLDRQLLEETRENPLVQGAKTRMTDDFSQWSQR